MKCNWQPAPKSWNAPMGTEYAENKGWLMEVQPVGGGWTWRVARSGRMPISGVADSLLSAKAAAEEAAKRPSGAA